MRRCFIAGNWKMNLDGAGAVRLARALLAALGDCETVEIGVFPPFVYLPAVAGVLRGSRIVVGAQDMHSAPKGAFTGEVSAAMLRDVGATHVIIGHSERRQYFGETDESVNAKLLAALAAGLRPIVCVGETLEQRKAGATKAVVGSQVERGLGGLTAEQVAGVVLAYEPVWAIGTGVTATPGQAQEVHGFIRSLLSRSWGGAAAEAVRVQYGGSVKADNARELLSQPDIDGALVGGASLEAGSFIGIVKAKEG